MFAEIQRYVPEPRFSLVSFDVIRPNVNRNIGLPSGNRFCSCFCWHVRSDPEVMETLGFPPETIFFSFFFFSLYIGLFQHSLFLIYLCRYRTAKYVVIALFYRTHTMSMLHYLKSHIILERYFLHSFNQCILLFSFSSIDRPVTYNN